MSDSANSQTGLLRLVLQHNLHPEKDLHPSWLPSDWPVRHRATLSRLTPSARTALGEVLRRCGVLHGEPDYQFSSRRKRLLLLDPAALRQLAFYTSLCAHAPLLRPRRDPVGAQIRRQACRFDVDAIEFVLERAPRLSALQMSAHALQERPWRSGRLLLERGYRLLLGMLAPEGEGAVQRMQRKLPRRIALFERVSLAPSQLDQLGELMLSCIVPERLARWDWLF